MLTLTKRNLMLFFKDKTIVLFSLLSTLIVLGLYIIFLGKVTFSEFSEVKGTNILVTAWVMSGILAIIPINSSIGSLATMLVDKEKGTYYDLLLTPVTRFQIIGGYVFSTFLITLILSLITLIVTEAYIFYLGGTLLSLTAFVYIIVIILLNTIVSTIVLFSVSLFFKNLNGYSLFNSILGTLIGFLTGIMIPIGQLPKALQVVVEFFPFSHSALIFRKILMDAPIKLVFEGASPAIISEFKQTMGIDFLLNSKPIGDSVSILYLIAFGLLCLMISFIQLKRKL